ncbi:MAG: hypothetical protein CM15mV22_1970 [Eurybiavirus sp.]|nr:MAG: hypothetical protein CM15mV22_1970 [Eurybiavirus sp.]
MFKIYRAEFTLPTTAATSTLVLENAQLGEANGGYLNLRSNALQTTSGSDEIEYSIVTMVSNLTSTT